MHIEHTWGGISLLLSTVTLSSVEILDGQFFPKLLAEKMSTVDLGSALCLHNRHSFKELQAIRRLYNAGKNVANLQHCIYARVLNTKLRTREWSTS